MKKILPFSTNYENGERRSQKKRAFNDNASGRKFFVPAGYVNTYKNDSDWDNFADDIYSQ